jgi:hypothetical protein
MAPLSSVRRHDVHVAVNQKRRCGALARKPRDEIGSLGVPRHEPRLDPHTFHELAGELQTCPLVARGV